MTKLLIAILAVVAVATLVSQPAAIGVHAMTELHDALSH